MAEIGNMQAVGQFGLSPSSARALQRQFLIYGTAIKTPPNTFQMNTYKFIIGGGKRG